MTKTRSYINDNGGRCEGCDESGTEYQLQQTVHVFLGGGLGHGTMWLCPKCLDLHKKKKDENGRL